jgi:hypothetical protein
VKKFKAILCILFGHSNIVSTWFGYVYCGRCEEQVGDTLAGSYFAGNVVIIGHNCETCRENYKKMTWWDKFLVPNPFKEKKE